MSGVSQETAAMMLEAAFKAEAYVEAAENWLALLTTPALFTDTGSTISEPGYTGYARLKVKASEFQEPAEGGISNLAVMKFAACTAGSDIVKGWALCTASSAGRVIWDGRVPTTHIGVGQTPEFDIGALVAKLLST